MHGKKLSYRLDGEKGHDMEKSKEARLRELIRHLRESAERNRAEAKKLHETTGALCNGYASAYELCAEWIAEIIQE